jgi:hypothetical protein
MRNRDYRIGQGLRKPQQHHMLRYAQPLRPRSGLRIRHDHYDSECTCGASASRPAADPAQDLRAIRVEITELKRRIDQIEARVTAVPVTASRIRRRLA